MSQKNESMKTGIDTTDKSAGRVSRWHWRCLGLVSVLVAAAESYFVWAVSLSDVASIARGSRNILNVNHLSRGERQRQLI